MRRMSTGQENPENIKEVLLNDGYTDSEKLQALQNLKKQFRPPDKIFCKLRLLPVLKSAKISLESKPRDKNFVFGYGMSLVRNIGRNSPIDPEIFDQLAFTLEKLKEDETLTNLLISKLWSKLENGSIFQNDRILNASKQFIEGTVLDLLGTSGKPQLEFMSKMAADSPQLFQALTSLFHEVLVRTGCHLQILQVQKLFIQTVKNICQREGKNFLGLYPKGCARLVALLAVPPQVFAEGREDILSDVISLLLEMFLLDKKKTLILLSHYPDWIPLLKFNLEQNKV